MATTEHTSDTVRRVVEEVLRRIVTDAAAAQGTSSASAAAPAPAPAARSAPAGTVLDERVVTLDLLARLPAGTRQVTVPPRAVITPSARDHARASGLAIVFAAATAPQAARAARPFVIAHADCGGDVARRCAAIARAVPGAQQLPPSGLVDVLAAIAAHAARDGGKAVLLTGRPGLAAVLANRHPGVRAVTGRDASAIDRAAADCSANVLVLDPRDFAGGLERACTEFASRDRGPVPPELAAVPALATTPCSCKTHPH